MLIVGGPRGLARSAPFPACSSRTLGLAVFSGMLGVAPPGGGVTPALFPSLLRWVGPRDGEGDVA